jgi:hypothetical protein
MPKYIVKTTREYILEVDAASEEEAELKASETALDEWAYVDTEHPPIKMEDGHG